MTDKENNFEKDTNGPRKEQIIIDSIEQILQKINEREQ